MASKFSELNVKIDKSTESGDTEQKQNVLNTSHSLDLTKKEIQSIEESEDLPPSPTISDQSADPELKESASDAADNTPRISILCVGDSLTWGYNNGGRRQYPYADTLSDKLRDHYEESAIFEVMECGVSGELVMGGMVDRLAAVLSHRTFDIVIHLGGMYFACILTVHSMFTFSNETKGTNDIARCKTAESICASLNKIYQLIEQHEAYCIAVTVPPTLHRFKSIEWIDDVRSTINSFIMKQQTVVDLYSYIEALSPKDRKAFFDNDGLHFSQGGYQQLGIAVYGVLQPVVHSVISEENNSNKH